MCGHESSPFSRKSDFVVARRSSGSNEGSDRISPKIEIADEIMFTALRLAKAGFFGGDPAKVLTAPVDIVESVIAYEQFEADYKTEYISLNKPAS